MIITHDINVAFHIAHKIAMLHKGRIIAEGSPRDFKRSSNPVVQAFMARREEKEVQE